MKYYKTQDPKYDICVDNNNDDAYLVNSTTKRPILTNEPIMIFRGKDKFATVAINCYSEACNNSDHIEGIFKRLADFMEYKENNPDVVKEPDTDPSVYKK